MNKIEINVTNYAPTNADFKTPDQSRIWVGVYTDDDDSECIGTGYIPNPFPLDYFGAAGEEFQRRTFSGELVKTVVMEHLNGGRSNSREYSSLTEYLADPAVKEKCRQVITGGLAYTLGGDFGGDPDKIDYINTCRWAEFPLEFDVSTCSWDSIVPQEWLNEFHADTIIELGKCSVWSDADKAIAECTVEDDLFGNRLFPVLKAPVELTSQMQSICDGFKSCSEPLSDSEFVYIGIRSKTYEIDTIHEIYAAGGWILCDQQWDW